jgi:hypothetical protein
MMGRLTPYPAAPTTNLENQEIRRFSLESGVASLRSRRVFPRAFVNRPRAGPGLPGAIPTPHIWWYAGVTSLPQFRRDGMAKDNEDSMSYRSSFMSCSALVARSFKDCPVVPSRRLAHVRCRLSACLDKARAIIGRATTICATRAIPRYTRGFVGGSWREMSICRKRTLRCLA